MQTVAVVGLGLIGGSVARDLAARGVRVLGHDRDSSATASALAEGVIHGDLGAGLERVAGASVVILAVPVDEAVELLGVLTPLVRQATLVTDVGSTKASIVAAAEAQGPGFATRFVGSHPLAGDHRSGWNASRLDLFTGAPVYLCPARGASRDATAAAASLWLELGGVPEFIDAAHHDAKVAWSSHLPQIVSSALALALDREGAKRSDLGPGGHDVTRLAGSSAEMWSAIARDNAFEVGAAIVEVERQLHALRSALELDSAATIREWFVAARRWYQRKQ